MVDLTVGNVSGTNFNNSNPVHAKSSSGFGDVIKGAIEKVDALERDANNTIVNLLEGNADVNESMVALQKADISMRLLLTVRNKVLDAYREIMRMQF